MFPYLAVLGAPSIFALFSRRAGSVLLILTFVIYVFFIGLRSNVGSDWLGYEIQHYMLQGLPLVDAVIRNEPLSYLLFWISENAGFHQYLSNVVAAIILVGGIFSFAKRTWNPWLAIVCATPYLAFVFGMSGIRQAMAAGVILIVFSRWEQWGSARKTIGILAAAMFHSSAIFALSFIVLALKVKISYKVYLLFIQFAIFTIIFRYTSFISGRIEDYSIVYLGDRFNIISAGSLFHIALIAVPALFGLLFWRRIRGLMPNRGLILTGIFLGIALIPINFISTTAASRLSVYLYMVPMTILPAISCAFGSTNRVAITAFFVFYNLLILAFWLSMGNNSINYRPYTNLLL